MDRSCDPPLPEQYLQQDLDAAAASGDIDVLRAGLPSDLLAADQVYMMSPFVEASRSVGAYQAMWEFLREDYGEFSGSKIIRMYKWLLHATAITKKKNVGLKETHLALNNGRFHIPQEADPKEPNVREEVFLKYYATACMLGLKQFFVETRTPVFRYFMDLDFKQPAELPPRSMEVAAFVVCRTLRKFWPERAEDDAFFRCIVSTTNYKLEPAKAGAEAASKVKSGVHLIWPEIFVSDAMALDIRESVIADLQDAFGARAEPAMNHWGDVVDLTVYKGSGLRMIGSNKTIECGGCKRKGVDEDGNTCRACGGHRTVDAGRPYMPLCVLDGRGRRDKAREADYLSNFYNVVKDTSIRSALAAVPDTGFRMPEGAPTFESGSSAGSGAGRRTGAKAGAPKATGARATKSMLDLASPEASLLQAFLRGSMGGGTIYASVGLQSVLANAKRTKFLANVQGANATFCLNVGRCHRSNRAYFEVTPEGCVQRCHDQTDVQDAEMRYGLCKDYRSKLVPLPAALLAALFPEVSAKREVMDNLGADVGSEMLAGGAEDEAAAASLDMRHDLKMRALLAAGDQLSMELHGMEWSSTVQVQARGTARKLRMQRLGQQAVSTTIASSGTSRHLPMYAEMDPASLGSRADEALRALGFAPAEAAEMAEPPAGGAAAPASTHRMLLDSLEVALLRQLRNAVHLAVSMDLEDTTAALRTGGLQGLLLAGRRGMAAGAMAVGAMAVEEVASPRKMSKVRFE